MTGGPTHAVAYHDVAPTNADPDKFEQESSLAERFERSAGGRVVPSAIRGGVQHEGQPISPSEALIAKNLHLSAIKTLADQFGGKIVDVSDNDVMVELTGKSTRVDAFLKLLRPFGVLEAARSGEFGSRVLLGNLAGILSVPILFLLFLLTTLVLCAGAMVMPRTPISRSTYDEEEDLVLEVQEMDASLLPPG
jgi:acetolactate synthase-1/3 small subunit